VLQTMRVQATAAQAVMGLGQLSSAISALAVTAR